MNLALREHVTSVGFLLTLSKRQIEVMFFLEKAIEMNDWEPSGQSHFVSTTRALKARGLIETRNPPEDRVKELVRKGASTATIHKMYGTSYRWRITEAGRLVLGLLRECGMEEDFGCKKFTQEKAA